MILTSPPLSLLKRAVCVERLMQNRAFLTLPCAWGNSNLLTFVVVDTIKQEKTFYGLQKPLRPFWKAFDLVPSIIFTTSKNQPYTNITCGGARGILGTQTRASGLCSRILQDCFGG